MPEEERIQLGKEIWKIVTDEVFTIGTVGLSPAAMGVRIVKNRHGERARPAVQQPGRQDAGHLAAGDVLLQELTLTSLRAQLDGPWPSAGVARPVDVEPRIMSMRGSVRAFRACDRKLPWRCEIQAVADVLVHRSSDVIVATCDGPSSAPCSPSSAASTRAASSS